MISEKECYQCGSKKDLEVILAVPNIKCKLDDDKKTVILSIINNQEDTQDESLKYWACKKHDPTVVINNCTRCGTDENLMGLQIQPVYYADPVTNIINCTNEIQIERYCRDCAVESLRKRQSEIQ